MKKKTFNSLLVGAGFLAGTVGVKALTSKTARKCYVQGVAKGLQVKQGYQNIVEEAKAQVDDIVAEANYNPLADDTPDSVFCQKGAGFRVAWDHVREWAHCEMPEGI